MKNAYPSRKHPCILVSLNLTLLNSYRGISIDECSNVAISDSFISNCQNGITIDSSESNIEVQGAIINGSDQGIVISETSDISISDSTFVNCNCGIYTTRGSNRMLIENCLFSRGAQGIYMNDIDDPKIANCTIEDCRYVGFRIESCLNLRLEWSIIRNCDGNGVIVDSSHNVTFIHSSLINNTNSGINVRYTDRFHVYYSEFWTTGIYIYTYTMQGKDIRVRDNTINGKPLIFKLEEDLSTWKMPEDAGQLFIFYCKNVNITGGHFSEIKSPILLYSCENVSVKGLVSSDNLDIGLEIQSSSTIQVENCITTDNMGFGISLDSCDKISVRNCLFSNNYGGLRLSSTRLEAEINHSTFKGDHSLLYSSHSGDLNLTNCTFQSDGMDGAYIGRPNNLRMENNSFIWSGLEIPYPIIGNIITSNNTVNGKTLVYLRDKNMDNSTLEMDPGQVILHNVKNLVLNSLNINRSYYGINGYYLENIIIKNSNITCCRKGIQSYNTNELLIENSSITDCGRGINLITGNHIRITNTSFVSNVRWEEYGGYNGFSVQDGDGLTLSSVTGSSVGNCTFIENLIGILLEYNNECDIVNCKFMNGESGILIGSYPNNCRILDNIVIDSRKQGVGIMGGGCEIWRNRLIGCSFRVYPNNNNIFDAGLSENNTVNGLPIMYRYQNEMVEDGTGNRGQYIAVDCTKVSISNLSMSGGTNSITVVYCDLIRISNCYFDDDGESIWMQGNSVVNLSGNRFSNTEVGINITGPDMMTFVWYIYGNVFHKCSSGLYIGLGYSYNSRFDIFKNIFYECDEAAVFYSVDECDFFFNDIIGSSGPVFDVYSRTSNIYSNNFFYNNGSRMRWDDGRFQGINHLGSYNYLKFYNPRDEYGRGNFWSDSGWLDANRDGIVDDPLVVDIMSDGTEIVDSKPLTEPVESAHITLHSNISQDIIRLCWILPEYDFLGDIESVTLINNGGRKRPGHSGYVRSRYNLLLF